MPNVYIGSILTALALAVTCAQAQQTVQHKGLSTPSATAAAVCSVNVTGSSAGLSTATISCRKGSIIAASDSDTAIALLRQNSTGVNWTTVDSCGLEGGTCLLAICGVSNGGLLDLNLAVAGYVDQTKYMWGVVCIAGNTRVHIKVGVCQASPAMVLLKQHCSVRHTQGRQQRLASISLSHSAGRHGSCEVAQVMAGMQLHTVPLCGHSSVLWFAFAVV
jgi:hypothetical protein